MMRRVFSLLGALVIVSSLVTDVFAKAYVIDPSDSAQYSRAIAIPPKKSKKPAKKRARRRNGKRVAGRKRVVQKVSSPEELEESLQDSLSLNPYKFSHTHSRFFEDTELELVDKQDPAEIIWEETEVDPFDELIVSWNSFRPSQGYLTIWVSVLYNGDWTRWHRLAQWGANLQRTFVNKLNPHVHTMHCRMAMLHKKIARGFRIKIGFVGGAEPTNLKALFACTSRLNKVRLARPVSSLPSVLVKGVPRQSQMVLKHPRCRDLCAPVSTGMIVSYLHDKLYGLRMPSQSKFSIDFARKAYDQGYLDIFGNWILNVAEAFNSCNGEVFFKVERLNSFHDLHENLVNKVPVAVSVRRLPGGATPYANGHYMVVVGWDKTKQAVLCIDPAFKRSLLRRYPIRSFLKAWQRSNNLAYVPMVRGPLSLTS